MTNSAMLPSEKARDIRAMLKRGCTPDYIRGVFGWGPRTFAEFCAEQGIALPSHHWPVRPPSRSYARRDFAAVRSAAMALEADRRNASKGHLLHLILAGTHARGLWPMLLNDSSAVASASPDHNSEQE